MKKIINNINIEKIFIFFLYMQPFLDVSAGILLHFNYSITISSIIRFLFMGLCIIYLLFVIKDKKTNYYLLLLLVYFIFFTITILVSKDISTLTYELKNLISTYYFVIIFLFLLHLYKNNKFEIKNMSIIYIIYLLLVFFPNILNIGFNSYWHSKEGQSGFFSSANVIGSILSITLPIVLINIKKINCKLIILLLINMYVIFTVGTKVPVFSFIIILSVNLLYYLISILQKKDYKKIKIMLIPIILVIGISIYMFPKTTFYKNIIIHINFLEKKDNGNITTKHLIDHFIFSERLTFEERTRKAYNKSNILEKVFGIGYIENYATDKIRLKTIEIDYFDIFYRHGLVGFVLFFIPIIYILKNKIKIRHYNYVKLNIILSLILIFTLALFQGHIFVTPNNSIFVALILSLTYNNSYKLTKKEAIK